MTVECGPGCIPPPPGLIAWWPLDEAVAGTLTIAQEVWSGLHGLHIFSPIPLPGKVDRALEFDGFTKFVYVPSQQGALDFFGRPMTIDAWIKPTFGTGNFGELPIVSKFDGTRGYTFFVKDGCLALTLGDGMTPPKLYTCPLEVPIVEASGEWFHVAVTISGKKPNYDVVFYVDGVPRTTLPPQDLIPPPPPDAISGFSVYDLLLLTDLDDDGVKDIASDGVIETVFTVDASTPPTGITSCSGASGTFVDWADNTEDDHASYNVYRADTPGGTYSRIATAVPASSYTDSSAIGCVPFAYIVTAVDFDGNESEPSEESQPSGPCQGFIRGDGNGDGDANIADAVHHLEVVFLAATQLAPCEAALDYNSDDALTIVDPLFLLFHLFGTGPAPAQPYPACGSDPAGQMTCCAFAGCGDP